MKNSSLLAAGRKNQQQFQRQLRVVFVVAALLLARRMEAVDFPVTVPGDAAVPGTLRSQIIAALVGPNNSVSFPSTFTATSIELVMGELVINKNLTIQGPGATNMLVLNNSGRVFHITSGANVSISGLTLTGTLVGINGGPGTLALPNGQSGESVNGGGIFSESSCLLTLSQCVMSNCTATGGNGGDAYTNEGTSGAVPGIGGNGGAASGGALASDGDCFLVGCTFVNDFSFGGKGGKGHDGGAGGHGGEADGGAVQIEYDALALSVINCTFNGNIAVGGVGGQGGDAWFMSPNGTAGGPGSPGGDALGGGIYVITGCPDASCDGVLHCTINGNECAPGFGGPGGAGKNGPNGANGANGIPYGCGLSFRKNNNTYLPIGNSIIAGNFSSSGFTPFGPDVGGTQFNNPAVITSNNQNLIGLTDGSTGWSPLDLQGSIATGFMNPLLGPLQINGGQTPTMAPLACSPAIDAGTASGLPLDQAGQNRTVPLLIPYNGSDGTDIGAYELQIFPIVKLNIVQASGDITLSWPVPDDACFILQQSTNLLNWMDANDQGNVTGTQKQVVIPEPVDGNLFFRLRHP